MSYEKQTWTTGDIITAEKLNHIENGIESGSNELIVHCQIIGMEYIIDKTYEEIDSAITNGKKVIVYYGSTPYHFSGKGYNESKGSSLHFSYMSSNIDNYGNISSIGIQVLYYYSNGEIGTAYRQIYSAN